MILLSFFDINSPIYSLWACFIVAFFIYGIFPYLTDLRYNLPPGPMPLPFIGNFAKMGSKTLKPWQALRQLCNKYGPLITFYFGQYRMVVLGDSKIIHEVLINQAKSFSWRQTHLLPGYKRLGTDGVINANYDAWRQKRRFGLRAMRDFGMGKELMVQKIQDEVSFLLPEFQARVGQPFNPKLLLTNSVSNVVCSLVFGHRFNYDDTVFRELMFSLDTMAARSVVGSALFMMFPFMRFFSEPPQARDFGAMQRQIHEMVLQSIEEHRQDFNPDNIRDFPDLYIKSQLEEGDEAMDLKQFGLVMTDMFAAGTETTSTALNWTLLYLATFQDIQQKCHDLIDAVLDSDRLPMSSDRPKLVYIDALMRETLRHSSFVPSALLHSNLENHAQVAGYDIPPYTLVMYNVTALHHDETYWKNPQDFNPDRWIDDDGKTLLSHSTHYMPFGIGPRLCLGEPLARAEYFIYIVAILQRFKFRLLKPVDITQGVLGIVNAPPYYELIAESR